MAQGSQWGHTVTSMCCEVKATGLPQSGEAEESADAYNGFISLPVKTVCTERNQCSTSKEHTYSYALCRIIQHDWTNKNNQQAQNDCLMPVFAACMLIKTYLVSEKMTLP